MHFERANKLKDHDQFIANLAMDIVVNETLLEKLNFSKEEIDPEGNFIWLDTINDALKKNGLIKESLPKLFYQNGNNYFEFYYKEIKDRLVKIKQLSSKSFKELMEILKGMQTMDDHQASGEQMKKLEDFLKNLSKDLSPSQKQEIEELVELETAKGDPKEVQGGKAPPIVEDENGKKHHQKQPGGKQAGTEAGEQIKKIFGISRWKNPKWETVIKDWTIRVLRDNDADNWSRINRRFASFQSRMKDTFLPSEIELEIEKRDKIDVWFFQDTSGSCSHLAQRFFKAAKSLPEDRFVIRAFCFDTKVYEIDLKKGELKGFGGTSFSVIESSIQNIVKKEKCPYPRAVFVITDGYGDHVTPEHPKRWHWFLSEDYKECIPKESETYNLEDFE
jgi:hypothetical protein